MQKPAECRTEIELCTTYREKGNQPGIYHSFCLYQAYNIPCAMVILHRQLVKKVLKLVKTVNFHKRAVFLVFSLENPNIFRYNTNHLHRTLLH